MAEDLKRNRYPADSTQQGSALFRLYCRLLIVTVRLYSPMVPLGVTQGNCRCVYLCGEGKPTLGGACHKSSSISRLLLRLLLLEAPGDSGEKRESPTPSGDMVHPSSMKWRLTSG